MSRKCENATQHYQSYLTAFVIILIVGFVWVMVSPQNEFAWLVLQTGLFGCFTIIVEVFHELGHILAGLMTKAKIFQVTIGLGRTLYSHDFWGIEFKFCSIPICGFTIIGFSNRKFYRMRSFLMTLGGPLANCFLILAAMILLFHISSPWLLALIRPFLAANVFALLFNSLLPRKVNFAGTNMSSDGLMLLTIPFMSKLKIDQEIEACFVWQGYSFYKRGCIDDARRSYKAGLTLFPNSAAIQNEMRRLAVNQ
jgi:hypothetical protein